jgi:hypothetical protein
MKMTLSIVAPGLCPQDVISTGSSALIVSPEAEEKTDNGVMRSIMAANNDKVQALVVIIFSPCIVIYKPVGFYGI